MDIKTRLRSHALARRNGMDAASRERKSALICDGLIKQAERAQRARGSDTPLRVAAYAPLRSEVDVLPFARGAYGRGWDVCFPCMIEAEDGEARMSFLSVPRQRFERAEAAFLKSPARPCAADVLERAGFARVDPRSIDFVVVPLVAFDDTGNRLGYGGGNYDRMIPQLRPNASTVGAAFAEQRVEEIPVEPHDQPLRSVVSA